MYKRVLLKLSGEVFKGDLSFGIDGEKMREIAKDLFSFQKKGLEIGLVIGGGNIWRYRDFKNLDFLKRTSSDSMGMMATVMNGLAFRDVLLEMGSDVVLMSKFDLEFVEHYRVERAKKYLKEGKIVIFAGGTGSPYFTTDSASALRALEIEADLLLKATKVDYVYDKDPEKYDDAKSYDSLSFDEVIEKKLAVMDLTCADLCRSGGLEMKVFNLNKSGNLLKILSGENIGTTINNF